MSATYSQAGQDIFAAVASGLKRSGTYLDIGCGRPIRFNNTYKLEQELGWRGLSVDMRRARIQHHATERKNPAVRLNALKANWEVVFKEHQFPNQIDYLSMDVDSASYDALVRLPWKLHRYTVITFEHAAYLYGPAMRARSRKFLLCNGYALACGNICHAGNCFEDWYVDMLEVPVERLVQLCRRSEEPIEWNEYILSIHPVLGSLLTS
jgi:hypothetical protein